MSYLTNSIKTLNKMGYTRAEPDEYQQAFIDHACYAKKPVLDIGAAYGVATIPALKKGACVIANDIDMNHLRTLKKMVPFEYLNQLTLKPGKVPGDVAFEEGSLNSVIAARSLHFLQGDELDTAFAQIYSWLEKGGRFFFVASTPYSKILQPFIPVFLKRKEEGNKWPGEINTVHEYFPSHLRNSAPKTLNVMDLDILEVLLLKHGFFIEKIGFFQSSGSLPEFTLDGRELVGAIAKKQ